MPEVSGQSHRTAARLILRLPDGETAISLTQDEYVLGRDTSSDIIVPLRFVSRRHARFLREGSDYRYIHLGRNPTLLDGEAIRDHTLCHGDCLSIGPPGQQIQLIYEQVRAEVGTLATAPTLPKTIAMGRTPEQEETITVGRDSSSTILLDSPVVSRHHARLLRRGDRVELEDLGSTNGTFVNGKRVQRQVLARGDVIRIGPYRFAHQDDQLLQYDEGSHARLEGYHLSVKIGRALILDDVSVYASPGEITAVAGVSGAGKSTLINALCGLAPASQGRVLINNSDLYTNFDSLRCLIGYVPQADIVHKELPLERALYYAARLRLPLDTPGKVVREQVHEVMAQLDLEGQRALAIRKMSGGQQKRASIAVELLPKPPLLFLDEPTSGLDPGLRRQLMEALRDVARQGKTIVLVTHDPDSLADCDQMIFLASGGKVAFEGPPQEALRYFSAPDYIEIYRKAERDKSPEEWKQEFLSSPQFQNNLAQRLPQLDAADATGKEARRQERPSTRPAAVIAQPAAFRGSFARFFFLTLRYAEVLARDVRNLSLLVAQAPIIAFFLALVSPPDALMDRAKTADANTLLLLLATSATWLGTINATREIVKELPIYVRERMMGIGPVPYVLSKLVTLSLLCIVQSWLLLMVVGLRVDLPADGVILPGRWEMFVSLSLTSLAALAMGLLISAASSTQERAVSIVPLVLIPQIIFAGVIFELSGVSEVLSFVSIANWSVELLGSTAGLPGGEYAANVPHQLSRWLILLLMGAAFTVATIWLMAQRKSAS